VNHFCVCGHLPKFHSMDFGRCEFDVDGYAICTCDHYEKDSDD
jgi:hypothetical protein